MKHTNINVIIIILLFLAGGIYVIFFTAEEDQSPYNYINKKAKKIDPALNPQQVFMDEFLYAEYLAKEGRLKKAYVHFSNVYHKYPEIPKGYIKYNALMYMKNIESIIDNHTEAELPENIVDTDYLKSLYDQQMEYENQQFGDNKLEQKVK